MSKSKVLKVRKSLEPGVVPDTDGIEELKGTVESMIIEQDDEAVDRVVTGIVLEFGPQEAREDKDAEPEEHSEGGD